MSSFKRVLFGAFVSLLLSSATHADLFDDVQKGNWEAVHKMFFKGFDDDPRTQYQAFLRTNENGMDLYGLIVSQALQPDDRGYEYYKELINLYEGLCIAYESPKPQGLSLDAVHFQELEPRATQFGFTSLSESAPLMITRRRSDSLHVVKELTRNPRQAMQNTLESSQQSGSTTESTSTTPTTPTKAQIFTSSLPTLSTSGLKSSREETPMSVRSKFQKQRRSKSAEERNHAIINDQPTVTIDGSGPEHSLKTASQELLRKVLGRRSKSAPETSNTITTTVANSQSLELITETVINSLGAIGLLEPKTEFEVGELAKIDCKLNGDVHLHFKTDDEREHVILLPKDPEPLGSGRQGSVYKVKDISGEKPIDIALKIKVSEDPEVKKQYENEIEVLEVIGSLKGYDIGRINEKLTHLLAMDLVPGKELFQYLYKVNILENEDREYERIYISNRDKAAKMIIGVVTAVNWLHDLGYMHRDLKPENILWDDETDTAKLVDFGYTILATLGTKEFIGSWGWKGPERTKEPLGAETHLSDLWGLGNIIFHILSKQGAGGNWMDFITKEIPRDTALEISHLRKVFEEVFSRIAGAERHKTIFDNYQDSIRKLKRQNPQTIYKIEDNPDAAIAKRNLDYPETQALFLAAELIRDDERQRPSSHELKVHMKEIRRLLRNKLLNELKEMEKKQIPLKKDLSRRIEEVVQSDLKKKELLKKSFDKESLEDIEKSQKEIEDLLKEVKKSVAEIKEKRVRARSSSDTAKQKRLALPRKSSVSPRISPKISPKKDKELIGTSDIEK